MGGARRRLGLACYSLASMAAMRNLVPVTPPALQVLTWNTLAPCYFREGRRVEADSPETYLDRHARIAALIARCRADVVCLQEHWFADKLTRLYEERLGGEYHILSLRRSGHNGEGRSEDGVAVLLRRESMVLEARQEHGIPQDRVALLAVVRGLGNIAKDDCGSGAGEGGTRRFVVLCTHLTYPHSVYDERSQAQQIAVCLDAVNSAARARNIGAAGDLPVLLCGDLNAPAGGADGVSSLLQGNGFRTAWMAVHGRECEATHVDHRGRLFASDHVFLKGAGLQPLLAEVLPIGVSDATPLRRPRIGGVRSAAPDASADAIWQDLSDHRPLLVALEWAA